MAYHGQDYAAAGREGRLISFVWGGRSYVYDPALDQGRFGLVLGPMLHQQQQLFLQQFGPTRPQEPRPSFIQRPPPGEFLLKPSGPVSWRVARMIRAGTAAVRAGRSVIALSNWPLAKAMVIPLDTSLLVDKSDQGLHTLISVYVTQGRVAVPGGQAEERLSVEISLRTVAEVTGLQSSDDAGELCASSAMSCLVFVPAHPCIASTRLHHTRSMQGCVHCRHGVS